MMAAATLGASAEAIWQAVVPTLPGFTVEVVPQIDSTNTELMRRARSAPLEPVLLVAEQQTAGRGRLGRGWHSQAGQSLTFSLGLMLAPPVRRSRLRRIRAQLLAVVALLPNAIFVYAVRYVNPSTTDWNQNLLVPMVLFGTAELAILFAAVVPLRLVLQTCVYLALSLCFVGAVMQPGFIPHVAVTFGILVAVLILDYRRSLIK